MISPSTCRPRATGSFQSIPFAVDVVQIFRRPEEVPPIVDQAIQIGARVVWMQPGIVPEEAAAKAGA